MKQLQKFQFEGTDVSFELNQNALMINATELSQKFNKKPVEFLRNQEIQDYIKVYCQSENSHFEDLVKIVRGGKNAGTWLHQKLAIRFAQWLSPEFSIWVDKKIEEILSNGRPSEPTMPKQIASGNLINQDILYFEIKEYENGTITTPSHFTKLKYLLATKDTLERMIYVMQNPAPKH